MSYAIYIDGQFFDRENAKVSVYDHTFLYGDGVFEGIRIYDGCIFRLQDHLERLYDSAKYITLKIPIDIEEMTRATVETVRKSGLRNGYIRLVITRGAGTLGLAPWRCPKPSVVIIVDTIALYPPELYENGLAIVTVPTRRNPVESLNARVKSCNYLNNILAKIEAQNCGCEEALMLDVNGFVIECTGDNVFIVRKNVIYTPPAYLGALCGVTGTAFKELAKKLGYEMREEPFTRYEVFTSDEMFLTGTAAEAIPVVEVDKRRIGNGKPGPVTQKLISAFHEITSKDGVQVYV